ncbi:MAG: hypothetical protein DI571_07240, partial [Arsenicicoccus sp.]
AMSYDITLCRRSPGQDWDDALAEADADDTATEADAQALTTGVETFRRIELRLREVLDGEIETWVAEETGGDVYGELTATQTGLQVELFDRSASVSLPDGEHDDLDRVHSQARRAVEIVADETGYEAYDHQTRSDFDGTLAHPVEVQDTDEEGGSARPSAAGPARRDPASLRRRGWFYLVLGILIFVFAVPRLLAGDTGLLTIMLLVIGVLDLLGGLMLLSVSKRATEPRPGAESEPGAGPTTP